MSSGGVRPMTAGEVLYEAARGRTEGAPAP